MFFKKILIPLFVFVLPLFAGELMYNDMFAMEQIKDSLTADGWEYRTEFPYFRKTAETGSSPKSCTFSPDGKYVYVPYLDNVMWLFRYIPSILLKRSRPFIRDVMIPHRITVMPKVFFVKRMENFGLPA